MNDSEGRATELGRQLGRIGRSLHALRLHMAGVGPQGVELASFFLLFKLVHLGPQRSSDLAAAASVDPSTASRQVAPLVRAGLVARQADPDDGRATLLAATDEGRRLHARMARHRDALVTRLVEDWPDADLTQLATLLSRLNDEFDAHRHEIGSGLALDLQETR